MISHKLLGSREWFVIHHTGCGMGLFTGEVIAELLSDNLDTAIFDGKRWSDSKPLAVASIIGPATPLGLVHGARALSLRG